MKLRIAGGNLQGEQLRDGGRMRTGGKWPHISDTGAVRAQDEVILQKPKQVFEEDRLAGSVSWHAVGRSVRKRREGLWVGKRKLLNVG